MNNLICPRCGVQNPSEMSFCSNCGQSLAALPSYQPNVRLIPPQYSPPSRTPTVSLSPTATAKSGKGLIFALLGCGGLLVISLTGLVVGGVFLNRQSNSNAIVSNANSVISNSRISNSNVVTNNGGDSAALDEMRSLKQVGAFKQTDVKTVPAADFYPSASEVAQVTYSNGRQTVVSTAAQFPSYDSAFADFDARMKNVKDGDGKIYNNLSKDGAKGSAYKYKEYYFVEACGEGVCWRNYSSELNAVKSFAVNFPGGSGKSSK